MTFTLPIITIQLAIAIGLLQAFLMFRVGNYRSKVGVNIGDGGDPVLLRRIRAHGNLAENGALVLVLLALAELAGAPTAVVAGFAILFLIARLAHAVAITRENASIVLRGIGAMGTVGSLAGLAITLIIVAELPYLAAQASQAAGL